MAKIILDGKCYEVEEGQNLLSSCLTLGKNLPYFCWHPAMGSVGACRQCAVVEYRDKDDERGSLVMSCMTPVKDGGIYSIDENTAREFRGSVIESLMTNHPHDCPICEEGGECHLQDMTEMSGHNDRRFRGLKRTHNNQYLGPFINHEMNRCIACYRCTRFYGDYAGGKDLQALGRNNKIYFGRSEDGMLQNGFSGNLVEVCPTGVFTDKTFSAHFVRKWDLQTALSVCEHCGVGCNTAPGARQSGQGKATVLRRVVNLYHRQINGYFLCDRGRFGYDYANNPERILHTQKSNSQKMIQTTAAAGDKLHRNIHPRDAVEKFADNIDEALAGKRQLIGIGSTRSSLENNFALLKLVKKENFYAGISALELSLIKLMDKIQRDPLIHSPTVPVIEQADAVIVLGEDISNTAPRIALAVRQAARNRQKDEAQQLKIPLWQDDSVRHIKVDYSPIFIFAVENTQLDDLASDIFYISDKQIVQLTAALIDQLNDNSAALNKFPDSQQQQIKNIAEVLSKAKKPLVISGCGLQSETLLQAAATLCKTLNKTISTLPAEIDSPCCSLYLAGAEANSLGMAQLCDVNKDLDHLMADLERTQPPGLPLTLVILETDLYRQLPKAAADLMLGVADQVIQLDFLRNRTSAKADLLLPAATTAESEGTLVNNNGLAQRHYAVYEGVGYIQESWRWLANAALACTTRAGGAEKIPSLSALAQWQHISELGRALAQAFPELQVVEDLGPDQDYRINGLKVARQSHRYSGRTAIHAQQAVAEQLPVQDTDAPMSFTMEGVHFAGRTPLQANIWAPGWNSNQAIHKFQQGIDGSRCGVDGGELLQRTASTLPDWRLELSLELGLQENLERVDTQLNQDPQSFRLLPLYRMFGSGELSAHAAAIASIISAPLVQMNPQDAEKLEMQSGDLLQMAIEQASYQLTLSISPFTPPGHLGVVRGFSGSPLFTIRSVPISDIKKIDIAQQKT